MLNNIKYLSEVLDHNCHSNFTYFRGYFYLLINQLFFVKEVSLTFKGKRLGIKKIKQFLLVMKDNLNKQVCLTEISDFFYVNISINKHNVL